MSMEDTKSTSRKRTTADKKKIRHLLPGGFAKDKGDRLERAGDIDRNAERGQSGHQSTFFPPLAPQTAGAVKAGGNGKVSQWTKLKGVCAPCGGGK